MNYSPLLLRRRQRPVGRSVVYYDHFGAIPPLVERTIDGGPTVDAMFQTGIITDRETAAI